MDDKYAKTCILKYYINKKMEKISFTTIIYTINFQWKNLIKYRTYMNKIINFYGGQKQNKTKQKDSTHCIPEGKRRKETIESIIFRK